MIPPWLSLREWTEHCEDICGSELPYHLRTAAELKCEPEWVGVLYLGHGLVPGGTVSTAPGAPGTRQSRGSTE